MTGVPPAPSVALAPPAETAAERAAKLGASVDTLLDAGRTGELCELVATAFAERSDAGDLAEIAALISALPDDVLRTRPRVLLELARACEAEARVRLRSRLLDRADALAGTAAGFSLALQAERIADLARDTRADEVEARYAQLVPELTKSVFADEAQVRASYALGRVLCWRADPVSLSRAEDTLQTAAGVARMLGRTEWRAQALNTLGYSVYFQRGEELRGAIQLREAMELLPVGHPRRAGIGTFLGEALVRSHHGDAATPLLGELRVEASHTGDQRSLGYIAWIMAVHTAKRGERATTLEWLAEAERHPGDWFEHSTGSEFLAEAAVCAERVGETALADRYLDRAQRRAGSDGYPEVAWFATGMINARRGDTQTAIEMLLQLLDEPWFPPREAWSARLHLALARLRAGDDTGAAADAERGFEAATALVGPGRAASSASALPDVLNALEPDLVRRLGPLAAAGGSAVAAALRPSGLRIDLFGGLAVSIGGSAVAVPQGKPAQLVILLATARTSIPVDVAVEELWPEVSGEVGRRRLRNVLARTRAACGELILRSSEALSLAASTGIDVTEFEQACLRVERAAPQDKLAQAQAALNLYRDDLLPEAAYAPRVLRLRDELTRRAIKLLELVATSAEQAGQPEEAIRALARITELDPYDVTTMERAAGILRRAGRSEQAAAWRQRAQRLLEE